MAFTREEFNIVAAHLRNTGTRLKPVEGQAVSDRFYGSEAEVMTVYAGRIPSEAGEIQLAVTRTERGRLVETSILDMSTQRMVLATLEAGPRKEPEIDAGDEREEFEIDARLHQMALSLQGL